MRIFCILLITILYHNDLTLGQVNRTWVQIDNRLFRIYPVGNYTWKQAGKECAKEHMHLIHVETDYDYRQLKGAIKRNFQNYSSFWTSGKVKYTSTLDALGLGRSKANQIICTKFDNKTLLRYQPDDCNKLHGFICERSLQTEFSKFQDKQYHYHIQPLKQFSCLESQSECSKLDMSLTPLKDYANRKMLQEYIFFNYGLTPSFWLANDQNCSTISSNNQTLKHDTSTPSFWLTNGQNFSTISSNNQTIKLETKLAFICERTIVQSKLTTRHLILIIFVALTTFGAILVYIIGRCCCSKKRREHAIEAEGFKNFKNTKI